LRDDGSQDIVGKEVVAKDSIPIKAAKEPPKPVVREFDVQSKNLRAKFVPVWRIRFRGR
jgi:hypothetical protein